MADDSGFIAPKNEACMRKETKLQGVEKNPPRLQYNASPRVYRSEHELPLVTLFLFAYKLRF